MKNLKYLILITLINITLPIFAKDEFLVDSNIVYCPVYGWNPAVVFGNNNYFVTWEDGRAGEEDKSDIFGTRVNKSGSILDSGSILISISENDKGQPAVAFGGANYLVVWVEESYISGADYSIYGVRVDTMGNVLDNNRISIYTSLDWQECPAIAFDGTNYLVVWQSYRSYRGDYDIYGARVSNTGTVLDAGGIGICNATTDQETPALAFDGNQYLVVWTDYRNNTDTSDIYGAYVNKSGVVSLSGLAISTSNQSQSNPSVAFDGTNYLVAWNDWRSGDSSDIYGTRVNKSGTVLDPNGKGIAVLPGDQTLYSVVFNGTNYIVMWDNYIGYSSNACVTRVDTSGTVLDPGGIAIKSDVWDCSIASDGTNCLITADGIYGTRISPSGSILDSSDIIVSTGTGMQMSPSASCDSTNYLVVWTDYRNDTSGDYYNDNLDIYGKLLNNSGNALSTQDIAISNATNEQNYSCVAFGDSNYFISWADARNGSEGYYNPDIYGGRVSKSGITLDKPEIPILNMGNDEGYPAIAFDGTNYMVVWWDNRTGSEYTYCIYGFRVSQTGAVLDNQEIVIAVSYWSDIVGPPAIAFDGTNYLVVWGYSGYVPGRIYGIRISTAGTVIDTAILISGSGTGKPAVAFDGTNYLVTWTDYRAGQYNYDIYGARVSKSGTVLDPSGIAISTAANPQLYPSIAFDGTNYLVVWEDWRNTYPYYGYNSDIYGASVNTSGTIINSFPVTTQSFKQTAPVVTKGNNNQLLITWSGWTDPPYNTMRIWGKFYPFAGVEEQSPGNSRQWSVTASPNLFRYSTIISYCIPAKSKVSLKLYDITGSCVKTLVNEEKEAGSYNINLNAKELKTGVYFVKLSAGDFEETKKLVIMK